MIVRIAPNMNQTALNSDPKSLFNIIRPFNADEAVCGRPSKKPRSLMGRGPNKNKTRTIAAAITWYI